MENKNKILIIDLETTAIKNDKGHIVEIGVCQLDLINGKKVMLFDNVVWEKGVTREEVDKSWIINNSSLTAEEIRRSQNLNKVRDNIQHIIHSHPCGITAFNNSFDYGWMESRGFHLEFKLPCLMKSAKSTVQAKNKRGNLKNPNVEEAYRCLVGQKEYVEQHRGGADAWDEADIAFMLFKAGKLDVPNYSIVDKKK